MRVEMSSKAERYIKGKGQSVMITRSTVSGCCAGAVPVLEIEFGSPDNLSRYEKEIVKGFTLFIDKYIDKEKKINIDLLRLLCFNKLLVDLVS